MKNLKGLLAVLLTAFVAVQASAQEVGGYLDLTKDQFIQGGLNESNISKELLPAFAGYAPNERSDEVIVFAFNYDIPRLQVAFKKATGTIYNKGNTLHKGEKLVATVNSRKSVGDTWEVKVVPRWLVACGNPLPYPVEITLWIPKWGEKQIVIQRVDIPKPYAVTVRENVIVQQLVPTPGNVELNLPPAKKGRYRLTEVGHEGAGHRWEYVKSLWDNFLDLMSVAALPIAELIHKAPNISINTSSQGGAGGSVGPINNNNSLSSVVSNANNTVVNTGSGTAVGNAASTAAGFAKAGGG